MRIFVAVLALTISLVACSMGGRSSSPVINRPLFKSLFYMGDSTGLVYKKECPGDRGGKLNLCKKKLVKRTINFCEKNNFENFKKERYILIKESDFLH